MTTLIDLIRHPSIAALAWALIHFLWQGALLGALAFVILRGARPERASTRYAIGVATLAAMILVFAATLAVLSRQSVTSEPRGSIAVAAAATPLSGQTAIVWTSKPLEPASAAAPWQFRPLDPWMLSLVVAVWTAGVLLMSIRLLGGWLLARRLATRAATAVPPAIESAARAIAATLQIRHAVAILESRAVGVPTLVGWIRPVVLLPAAALAGLSPDQLRAILAHELAHVRRHDYLVNLLQSIVETLLFYHPATWWVSARVRAEREHCCDDLAVEVCGDRLVYASALAELTALAGPRRLALAATDGSLLNRVRRILGGQRSIHEPAPAWPLLALAVVLAGAGSFDATATGQQMTPALAAAANHIWIAAPQAFPQPPEPPLPPESPSPAPPVPPEPAELPEPAQAPEPPAPPEPPVPPAPPRQEIGSRGSGNMTWSNDNERFSVRWTGAFRISDDERDIEWVEDGATVTVTDGVILTSRVELRGTRTGIERQYWRNGQRREFEPEGREFLAAAIEKMIRNSGAFAKERVARFLKRGGPDAVLAEIDRLSDSSYVRRVYYTELLTQAPPSDALVGRVLQRVPGELRSDYDKATLLTAAAALPVMNDSHRVLIARAAQSINSDYDQRRTLVAILNKSPLAPAVATAVLEASGSVGSSHDRSQVLLAFVEQGGLTAATTPAFMAQLGRMSSHDQRRVLTAVSSSTALTGNVAVEAVRAAGAITSSHDQSTTLISLIDRGGLTDATADAFFQAAARITSSHDLSRVLLKVLERPAAGDRIVEGVLRTAARVSSSYNRAQVLLAVAARGRLPAGARKLYIDASRNLGTHDENRVLAALVRAEGN